MKQETEIWKDVIGYEGKYKISSLGRIKSLDRICQHFGPQRRREKILNYSPAPNGYIFINMEGGEKKYIHDMVCAAFHGPKPKGHYVDHINHIRADNRIVNLRYITIAENASMPGEKNPFSKLTDKEVLEIRSKYKPRKYSCIKLGKEYNIDQSVIHDIVTLKSWKHI